MPDYIRERRVYDSAIVSVADVCCRPHDGGCGDEEYACRSSIAFVRSGAFVKHVGGEEVLADANHVLFFNADEPYRVSHPIEGGDDCTSLRFDAGVLTEAISTYDPSASDCGNGWFPVAHALSSSSSAARIQRLRGGSAVGRDPMWADELCLTVLGEVLADAFTSRDRRPPPLRPQTQRAHRRLADAARMLLAEQYAAPVLLADVAEQVSSSPFHLVRIFHREIGLPVHRYANRLRLRAALERLAGGCDDLTALALDLGFSSHSHFTDAFRREFGVAPSAFRRAATKSSTRRMSKKLEVQPPPFRYGLHAARA